MASEELFSEPATLSEEIVFDRDNLEDVIEDENEPETHVDDEPKTPVEKETTPDDTEEVVPPSANVANAKEKATEKSNEPRLVRLPLARIRNLMKLDPDLHIATLEAVFTATKATEMFIDSLAKESFVHTSQAKKKTVQKRDVDMAIASVDSLMFLEGAMNF